VCFPVSEKPAKGTTPLAIFPELSERHVDHVSDSITEYFGGHNGQ
jgi:dTDP-4-amino-4,6-dideoxygalactose transaminase